MNISYALVCNDAGEHFEIVWDFGQAIVGTKRKPMLINQITRILIYVHQYTNDLTIAREDIRAAHDTSDYQMNTGRIVKWADLYDKGFNVVAYALKTYADNGLSVRGAIRLAKDLRGVVLTLDGFQDLEPDVSKSMLDIYKTEAW